MMATTVKRNETGQEDAVELFGFAFSQPRCCDMGRLVTSDMV